MCSAPEPQSATLRETLKRALRASPMTVRELAVQLGLPERAVLSHLAHLERSLRGERLVVEPAVCRQCGFVFRKRARFSRPSRCPRCKGEHIEPPRLRILHG